MPDLFGVDSHLHDGLEPGQCSTPGVEGGYPIGNSAAARAESRFKQLCCLGLGGEAVMPALVEEFRTIVPSGTSTFFFADERGEVANIDEDSPETPEMVQVYMEEFHGKPGRLPPGFDFTHFHARAIGGS